MVKKRVLLRIAALVAVVGFAAMAATGMAQAGQVVYVAGGSNEFGTLNLATGAFSQIGTLNLPSGDLMFGMGFGADGNLYGVDSQSNANLWEINVTNGNVTDIGALGQSAIDATTDAAGKMFALSQDANALFYTLNPPSTSINVVGLTGITSGGLAAVNAAGTELFTSIVGANPTYDTGMVNVSTGVATDLGQSGFFVENGLFVGSTLYGFDSSGAIVTLNTTTGAGTQVGTYDLPNGDAILASAVGTSSVPEPSTLRLGLISTAMGLVISSIWHRRRRALRRQA